jgi:hypothetical protein
MPPCLVLHRNAPFATALLALLILLALPSPAARAEEYADAKATPQATGKIMGFVDAYHGYLESKLRGPTLWFDNFFGDTRLEDDDIPSTSVRLRLAARFTEGQGFRFPVRLNANVVLPRVNRRLRLIAFGGNRDEDLEPRADDAIDSSLRPEEDQDRSRVGLRYMIYKSLRDRFHFGGGLTVGWPMESYVRMQYLRLMHLGKQNVVRFSETGYWNTLHGSGETSRLDLERVLPAQITGRLSLFASYLENDSGLQWGAETSFFRQLSAKSALSLDLGVYGVTRPDLVTTYRIATRYRRNFLRPWLFFEIEPELQLPLEEDNETRQALGILTLALECQFYTASQGGGSK